MALFTDNVQGALERALDGVALRQRVTAGNIANVMTPGYSAKRVEFENALAAAVDRGTPCDTPLAVVESGDAAREDGNNVSIEEETMSMMRSGLQYQAVAEAANFKLSILRTAISGR